MDKHERIVNNLSDRIFKYQDKADTLLNKLFALDEQAGAEVCEILKERGHSVTPLDVKNLSCCDNIEPILYDGKKIPFKDNKFDVALIITVLHHTPNPAEIIKEAKRVCKRIIIVEDINENKFRKYLTNFLDSLYNLEFIGHPHSNKTDQEWKALFKKLELKIKDMEYIKPIPVFRNVVYHLEG